MPCVNIREAICKFLDDIVWVSSRPYERRQSAPARNSNSGACYAAFLSRVPVVVTAAWWRKLRRTCRDLKDLDKMGFNRVTLFAVIAFAPPPLVRSVVTVTRAPMETLHQLMRLWTLFCLLMVYLVQSLTWLFVVNDWEITPWAYRTAELVLRECWRVGFGFVSCVLLWSSLADVDPSVVYSAVLGGVVRPL